MGNRYFALTSLLAVSVAGIACSTGSIEGQAAENGAGGSGNGSGAGSAQEGGGDPGSGGSGASGQGGSGSGASGSGGAGASGGAGTGGNATGGGGTGTPGPFDAAVTVHLEALSAPAAVVSFGLPVPPGALADPSTVRLAIKGNPIVEAKVEAILHEHDAQGKAAGVRAIRVQIPSSLLGQDGLDVDVAWSGDGPAPAAGAGMDPYSAVSFDSPDEAQTADRTIQTVNGKNQLVETKTGKRTLFVGREPRVLATYPPGYLAATGILGPLVASAQAASPDYAGLSFLSDAMSAFGLSAMYAESYKLNAYENPNDTYAGAIVDPVEAYEAWLYDRCATFLTAYAHTGDVRFYRHALRSCSYYASKVELSGPNAGIWSGKGTPDNKYSHLRGLYAYYALTGDEAGLAAGKAIAEMWLTDQELVGPYRDGHTRGYDKLWTERLLGTALEGLYYGHRLTGDAKFLSALEEMVDTAYLHLTGDAAALAKINPGYDFPPQNCFIHSGIQHADAGEGDPWCSGWMTELVIDPLLQYEMQTGDARVSEMMVRLTRFLRDVGSAYFKSDPYDDTFMNPEICYVPGGESVRMLVPLYGSGIRPDKSRANFGDWSDFEHCTDATALVAAGIRALKKQGKFEQGGPIGPFPSEGASFSQLHAEFAACAKYTFEYWTRPKRDPANWTSDELAAGLGNPESFINSNKIGYPKHPSQPLRKLSWWFNVSMLQFGLLADVGHTVPKLTPGVIQPPGCN